MCDNSQIMPMHHAEDGSTRTGSILARQKEQQLWSLMPSHRPPSAPLPLRWRSYLGAPQSCSTSEQCVKEEGLPTPSLNAVRFNQGHPLQSRSKSVKNKIKQHNLQQLCVYSYASAVCSTLCGNLSRETNQPFNMDAY